MKHYCPMCGEQWNEDVCETCGWKEPAKNPRPSLRYDGVDVSPS
jgi:hypothetical protein